MLIQQKLEHRVSVGLRLLDIGDMRGIKDRDLRARDVVADEFIGFQGRCRIVFACESK